jgi:hypothetical protein
MLMMVNLSLLWKAIEIRARTADAVFEAFLHCALGLRLLFTVTLKSSLVSSSCLPLNTCGQDLVAYVHHLELTYVKLHCPKLMLSVSLFRQFCRAYCLLESWSHVTRKFFQDSDEVCQCIHIVNEDQEKNRSQH